MKYNPYAWELLKVPEKDRPGEFLYKVFGEWKGGYTSGDSWRLNSGIVRYEVEPADDSNLTLISFYGESGSVYECILESEGVTGLYAHGVLAQLVDKGCERIDFEDFVQEFSNGSG